MTQVWWTRRLTAAKERKAKAEEKAKIQAAAEKVFFGITMNGHGSKN